MSPRDELAKVVLTGTADLAKYVEDMDPPELRALQVQLCRQRLANIASAATALVAHSSASAPAVALADAPLAITTAASSTALAQRESKALAAAHEVITLALPPRQRLRLAARESLPEMTTFLEKFRDHIIVGRLIAFFYIVMRVTEGHAHGDANEMATAFATEVMRPRDKLFVTQVKDNEKKNGDENNVRKQATKPMRSLIELGKKGSPFARQDGETAEEAIARLVQAHLPEEWQRQLLAMGLVDEQGCPTAEAKSVDDSDSACERKPSQSPRSPEHTRSTPADPTLPRAHRHVRL